MPAWPTDHDPFEADRHAIARLLQARGEAHAAAIVALSVYRPDHVDNWDGGQYEATLEVPPEFYGQVAGYGPTSSSTTTSTAYGHSPIPNFTKRTRSSTNPSRSKVSLFNSSIAASCAGSTGRTPVVSSVVRFRASRLGGEII